jgi:glycosyltransferase involved in cell wall biosynthesis
MAQIRSHGAASEASDAKADAFAPLSEQPLVSVITPSLNSGSFIEATIRSICVQDYPRIEHIVLDSGSIDQTFEVLARYPAVRVVTGAPDGVAAKVNRGYELAGGEIVMYLPADDVLLPGAIGRAVDELRRHPEAAGVYANFMDIDVDGNVLDRRESRQAGFDDLVNVANWMPHQATALRLEAVRRVGGLDTRYRFVSDWDLCVRISRHWPLIWVDDYWGGFRLHEGQLSDLNKYRSWRESRAMSRRYGGRFFSPLFFRFYGGKIERAARMLASGDVRLFARKLGENTLGRLAQR